MSERYNKSNVESAVDTVAKLSRWPGVIIGGALAVYGLVEAQDANSVVDQVLLNSTGALGGALHAFSFWAPFVFDKTD